MSSPQTQFCLNVDINGIRYESTTANEFVVLAFFLCFIFAAILVVLLLLYVIRKLKADKEREKLSEIRRTMRQNAAKKFRSALSDDEDDAFENLPLKTNYIWTTDKSTVDVRTEERRHSTISFFIDEHKLPSPTPGTCVLEILANLFTSNKNSSSPTNLGKCFWFRLSCFELLKSFHREAFLALVNLTLTALLEEKLINEMDKLNLITKYEQMLDEDFTTEELADFTCKLHCVLARFEKEIHVITDNDEKSQENPFTGERLCKQLVVIQREMLSHKYNEVVKDMLVNTENSLVKIIVEQWFNLEVIRYRMNVVYESIEGLFEKKGEKKDTMQDYLNSYLLNIYEKLSEFCITYEKEISDLINQIKKDKQINRKQAMIEMETQRCIQRMNAMQDLKFKKKKAVSKFVIAQIDSILNDFKTILNYQLVVNSEGLELLQDFQKSMNRRVVKLLRSCEEELFDRLERNEIATEENLVELGKALSSSLKDFKLVQENVKVDFLEKGRSSIRHIGNLVDSLYLMLEANFTKGVEDMKKEYLEILHSLSNLQEEEMNKLEHDFEIGFSCLVFNLYFVVMTEVIHKIHAAMSDKITKYSDKDISLSLHDMVQILKQDKSVINRSSLFQIPNKELYSVMENDMKKFTGSLSLAVDDYLEAVIKKTDSFFLPQVNSIIQKTILRQSQQCVSNLYIVREKLLSCSMDRKGYMSKQGSSLAKDCYEQIMSIWESQANFKAHKLREGKDEVMREFNPVIETFFNGENEDTKYKDRDVSFQKTLKLEREFFETAEELMRGDSVERVLDSNLENELMVIKLHEKFESYEPRTDDLSSSQRRNFRSQLSHKSEGGSRRRKESLRHSISKKSKKL